MNGKKIIFMGTPYFAKECLAYLHSQGCSFAAVVTGPDKPSGRGLQVHQSEVKKFALENKIPVLQPFNLKDEEFISTLKQINADLFVVVAFRMLPEIVWEMPPFGTINLHASLLPQYRGAAPINWAIINGEIVTGVSTFFIEKEIDTGQIIAQTTVNISNSMNAGELHDALLDVGKTLLYESIQAIFNKKFDVISQASFKEEKLLPAPKIFKADCKINWSETAQSIHNKIRGLSPIPSAFTSWKGKSIKLFASRVSSELCQQKPGTVKVENKTIAVATTDYWLYIDDLQVEGKKRMPASAFILGNQIAGTEFEF